MNHHSLVKMPNNNSQFNRKHVVEFGLVVTETGTVRNEVKSVSCRFCSYYGRNEGQAGKRKRTDIPLKTALDALPAAATFKDSWSIPSLAGRFDHLKDFAGGLASPFPHTATVESDFSIVKWETDGARTQMEHYSLEGIMQCKEHECGCLR